MENKPRKWWISGLLSLLNPGLGQIYNGQARKAIFLLVIGNLMLPLLFLQTLKVYSADLPLLILLLAILISLGFYAGVITDAIRQANKRRSEYRLKKYNKLVVYIGTFLVFVMISALVPSLEINAQKIKSNYVQAYKIPSASMEPTLLIGDHILVDRRLSARNPIRGNLIVFEYPEDKTKDFVKRVEAVGGDIVEIRNKKLYVNNKLVKETQVIHLEPDVFPADKNPRDYFGPVTVPKDSYFVMGDNRDRAYDSRFFGFVDKSKIKGIVRQIYWSWDKESHRVRWNRIGNKVL